MKRFLIIATALLISIPAFTGCNSSGGTVVYPNAMTGTIAGVLAFSATGGNISATITNGTLNIAATAASNAKIYITIPSYAKTIGTLAISDIGLPVGASYDSLGNGHLLNTSTGSITFTAVTPYLVGTFNIVCSDSTKITGGTFKIKAP